MRSSGNGEREHYNIDLANNGDGVVAGGRGGNGGNLRNGELHTLLLYNIPQASNGLLQLHMYDAHYAAWGLPAHR